MNDRHAFLLETIGAYPEEIDAHWLVNFLSMYVPLILTGGAILQFFCFWLYNGPFHPYKDLVKKDNKSTFYFELGDIEHPEENAE